MLGLYINDCKIVSESETFKLLNKYVSTAHTYDFLILVASVESNIE